MSGNEKDLSASASQNFSGAEEGSNVDRPLILVVEDDVAMRAMVVYMFDDAGIDKENIIEAANGVDAVKAWIDRKNEIGVVFTDNNMPRHVEDKAMDDIGLSYVLARICHHCDTNDVDRPLMMLHSNDVDNSKKLYIQEELKRLGTVGVSKLNMNSVMPDILKAIGADGASEPAPGVHNN